MRQWFPFTDYDFYAYLASGSLLLAVVDFALNDAQILTHDWTLVSVIVALSAAYATGHIIGLFSAAIFERLLVGGLFSDPLSIQIGLTSPTWRDAIAHAFAGRDFKPMDVVHQEAVQNAVKSTLSLKDQPTRDQVFRVGYNKARENPDTRQRIDEFRNLYGFSRNMSFVAAFAIGVFLWTNWFGEIEHNDAWIIISGIAFVGMSFRYLKFYSCFSRELARSLF